MMLKQVFLYALEKYFFCLTTSCSLPLDVSCKKGHARIFFSMILSLSTVLMETSLRRRRERQEINLKCHARDVIHSTKLIEILKTSFVFDREKTEDSRGS